MRYECPLQTEIEKLQEIANNLRDKAIQEYESKGWQACHNSHYTQNGILAYTCILINTNVVPPNTVKKLIEQGKTIEPDELVDFKKYLSYELYDDHYIIF